MTATQLLKLSLEAIYKCSPPPWTLPGHLEMPPPFDRPHSPLDLVHAIKEFLANDNRFTVILGYPPGMCEKPGETYSSSSAASTWEAAVLAVAREMREEELVEDDDELTICDVFQGETSTFPGTDRYAVIRFYNDGTPRLLTASEAQNEDNDPLVNVARQLDEGWVLMNEFRDSNDLVMAEIQRDDGCDIFDTDAQALSFVRGMAAKGKIYHQRALILHERYEVEYRANFPAPGEVADPSKKEV